MRYVAFETSDGFEKVTAFYRAYLPEYGWACVHEEGFPTYEWTDITGQVPWRLRLVIAYEILLNYETKVELHIYRYPDTAKIALYPGAQQLEVKSLEPRSLVDRAKEVHVTTYVTAAKPKDIEGYYKSVLKDHAWLFDDKKSVSIVQEPGIIFHHWYGTTIGGPRGAHVYIVAKAGNPGADQFTKVEIIVEDYDVAR